MVARRTANWINRALVLLLCKAFVLSPLAPSSFAEPRTPLLGCESAGIITTVAGTGDIGDDGDATSAQLNLPWGIVLDPSGNLFIADEGNHRVRRVDAETGIITTVAGTGVQGSGGDGGPATAAQLRNPRGVALDTTGNLFISDTLNDLVRRVDAATGIITTVAGPAAQLNNPRGLVLDAAGNLFIADTLNDLVRRVDAATGIITTIAGNPSGLDADNIPATLAKLAAPNWLALDVAGNLFIADAGHHRIRRVDAQTQIITTVAGNGTQGFSGDGGPATAAAMDVPRAIALDGAGNLFISGFNEPSLVRRVDATTGIITTFAGTGALGFSGDGGPAKAAEFADPLTMAVDGAGNLFIADQRNSRVRMVDASTSIVTTVAGGLAIGDGGLATDAQLNTPNGVALDSAGNLFVGDFTNARIRHVEATTGVITTVAGTGVLDFSGDGGPATAARLFLSFGVTVDAAGNFFIAEAGDHRVRRVDAATGIITTVAGTGVGGFAGDGGPATAARLNSPRGVALDGVGNMFIADFSNFRIRRVDAATKIITTVAGTGVGGFSGDGGLATAAQLNEPRGISLDGMGNMFIADTSNHRIRRVDAATKIISTVAGTGLPGFSGDGGVATAAQLNAPRAAAVDGAGSLFIADTKNHRIRRVDATTRIITTVAGTGIGGFSGDDAGPATEAQVNFPTSVALDGAGSLFLADTDNHRIRAVCLAPSP